METSRVNQKIQVNKLQNTVGDERSMTFKAVSKSDLVFNHRQSAFGDKSVHINRMPMIIYNRRTTGSELKTNKLFRSRAMRWGCLLPIVLLSTITFGMFVYFSILNINDIRHLKTSNHLMEERIQQMEKENKQSMASIQLWQNQLEQFEGESNLFDRFISE
jgi:hypothetical protein